MTRSNVLSRFFSNLGFTFHLPADRAESFEEALNVLNDYKRRSGKWLTALYKASCLAKSDQQMQKLVDLVGESFDQRDKMALIEVSKIQFHASYSEIESISCGIEVVRFYFGWVKKLQNGYTPNEWVVYLYPLYKDVISEASYFEDLPILNLSDLSRVPEFHKDWDRIAAAELMRLPEDNTVDLSILLKKSRKGSDPWIKALILLLKEGSVQHLNEFCAVRAWEVKELLNYNEIFDHLLMISIESKDFLILLDHVEQGDSREKRIIEKWARIVLGINSH